MQRVNDIWNATTEQWETKRLGPKGECDFYDMYTDVISEKVLLGHWWTESTCDGSTVQRQMALRNAIVHIGQAQERYRYESKTR